MVGQGVLRECLLDPEVESVLTIGRNATVQQHEKLHEIGSQKALLVTLAVPIPRMRRWFTGPHLIDASNRFGCREARYRVLPRAET